MGKKLTTLQFVEKAQIVHGNKYDYSLVEYVSSRTKVKIICKIHGTFEQTPMTHLKEGGCTLCTREKITDTTENFIEKAKKIHKNEYNYSKVNYKNSWTKVTIICKEHKDFQQSPNCHLSQKQGCPSCAKERVAKSRRENPRGWSYTSWKNTAGKSKFFDSFKVYIIKCWNENEEFYKIGKTYMEIKNRFDTKARMPYNYEVIRVIEGGAKKVSELEVKLQKENKNNKYTPKLKFSGMYECFHKISKK